MKPCLIERKRAVYPNSHHARAVRICFFRQDLIPLMASSIAAMVGGSEDVEFRKKCLQVSQQEQHIRRISSYIDQVIA